MQAHALRKFMYNSSSTLSHSSAFLQQARLNTFFWHTLLNSGFITTPLFVPPVSLLDRFLRQCMIRFLKKAVFKSVVDTCRKLPWLNEEGTKAETRAKAIFPRQAKKKEPQVL